LGDTRVGTPRNYYPGSGGDNNLFTFESTYNNGNFESAIIEFQQHASVSFIEEIGLNKVGYDIVDVAQHLSLAIENNVVSYSLHTSVFPSATLNVGNINLITYPQPSFKKTHRNWFNSQIPQSVSKNYYPSKFYKR
jgi:hypothetical protein